MPSHWLVTPITFVLALWHLGGLTRGLGLVNVPIGWCGDVSPIAKASPLRGVVMRLMHLCYAALGFAIARWVFQRQAVAVVDPVNRFRVSGLL